jgi:RimJ/RimL family protein N-acetyltransferase
MGQICIAPEHRGRGIFDALYAGHRRHFADAYDLLVTEVATRNGRSLRAHLRVGFEEVLRYRDDVDEWVLIALPLSAG